MTARAIRTLPLPAILLFVLSLTSLSLGFYRDQWQVVREKKFKSFQTDSESLVLARMVHSRQYGIFSQGALLGWGDADPLNLNDADYTHQYDTYVNGGTFQTYSVYKSQTGLQAMLFGALDAASPLPPVQNLRLFRALTALLLAATFSVLMVWLLGEFGAGTALFVLLTTLVSQWITLFGRNLFYFTWAFYLPMLMMTVYLAREAARGRPSDRNLALVAFLGALLKCLFNGYDFIIPSLAMIAVPLVYYGLRDAWGLRELVRRLALLSLAAGAGVLVSLMILAMQLQTSEGSFGGGVQYLLDTLSRRTYGDPAQFPLYAESLEADPFSVLWTYISQDTAIAILGVRFLDLILLFAAATLIHLGLEQWRPAALPDKSKARALIGATWFSLLSPVSWFLLFKGQAYVHMHTNYLAWHMPFTLFGFTLCGFVLRRIMFAVRRSRPAPAPTA